MSDSSGNVEFIMPGQQGDTLATNSLGGDAFQYTETDSQGTKTSSVELAENGASDVEDISGQGIVSDVNGFQINLSNGATANVRGGTGNTFDESAGSSVTINSADTNTIEDASTGQTYTISDGSISASGDSGVFGAGASDTFSVNGSGSLSVQVMNPSGVITDNDTFSSTGELTQDQQFSDGTLSDAINYSNGVETDEAFYNSTSQLTADAVFNTSGQQTDYDVYDTAGQLTQDQQVSNGYVVDAINYTNGIKTSETFYNSAQQETGSTQFNPDGSSTQMFYDPSTGALTAENLVNADGSQTDYTLNNDGSQDATVLNADGQRTEQAHFNTDGSSTQMFYDPSTETLTGENLVNADGSQTDYTLNSDGSQDATVLNADGQRTEQAHFNTDGSSTQMFYDPSTETLTGENLVNADGSQTDYTINSDGSQDVTVLNAAGQTTQTAHFNTDGSSTQMFYDPSTETLTGENIVNADGSQTDYTINSDGSETANVFNAADQKTDTLLINATGVETQDSQYDVATGTVADVISYTGVAGNNQITAETFYDQDGNKTQVSQYDPGTGLLAEVWKYSDGTLSEQLSYLQGQLSEAEVFADGKTYSSAFEAGASYAYSIDISDGTVPLESEYFDQNTGQIDSVDKFAPGGQYIAESDFSEGGQYFSWVSQFSSTAELGTVYFNSATGVETSVDQYVAGWAFDSTGYDGNTADYVDVSASAFSATPGGDGDPIVLNLAGGQVQTQGLAQSNAHFDMQNNGASVSTGWATAGEGMLVYDPNGTGTVTNDASLVGGFSQLAALDSNGDGKLNASDAAWQSLKVWIDQAGNGNFQTGELYSMAQLGITSINLNAQQVNMNSNGNTILANSTFTYANGTAGDMASVDLAFTPGVNNNVSVAGVTSSAIDRQVALAIQAMAAFSPQAAGSSPLTSPQVEPHTILAANTH